MLNIFFIYSETCFFLTLLNLCPMQTLNSLESFILTFETNCLQSPEEIKFRNHSIFKHMNLKQLSVLHIVLLIWFLFHTYIGFPREIAD